MGFYRELMAPMLAKPFRGVKTRRPANRAKFELMVSLKESPRGSGSKLLTGHRRMRQYRNACREHAPAGIAADRPEPSLDQFVHD
jgi:hypothetical protein